MIDRIAVSPTIHFGKPCIAGTRIPDEEANEESAAPQVPDISDPAMRMADGVEYLTTD